MLPMQDSEKCFTCDSRNPTLRESHRIENVIYLHGPHSERSWWQSENGESMATPHVCPTWAACLSQDHLSLQASSMSASSWIWRASSTSHTSS